MKTSGKFPGLFPKCLTPSQPGRELQPGMFSSVGVPTRLNISWAWFRSLLPARIGLPLNISPKTHLNLLEHNPMTSVVGLFTQHPTCLWLSYNAEVEAVVREDGTIASQRVWCSLSWLHRHLFQVEEGVHRTVEPSQNQRSGVFLHCL